MEEEDTKSKYRKIKYGLSNKSWKVHSDVHVDIVMKTRKERQDKWKKSFLLLCLLLTF